MTGDGRRDGLPRRCRAARRGRVDRATRRSGRPRRGRDRRGSGAGSAHSNGPGAVEIPGSSDGPDLDAGHASVPGDGHEGVGADLELVGFVVASKPCAAQLAGEDTGVSCGMCGGHGRFLSGQPSGSILPAMCFEHSRRRAAMTRWEYLIVALPRFEMPTAMPESAAVAALNREGAHGWEAVGMT